MEFFDWPLEEDAGGFAAQTGSLTHVGVAEFHAASEGNVLKVRKEAAWAAIVAAANKFPLADPDDVRMFMEHYMNDPRNINAIVVAVEKAIKFTIPAHSIDPTGMPIYVTGHVDQIRFSNNLYSIWDLKTGKPSPYEMNNAAAVQLASYTYGVRQSTEWVNAEPGGLIRAYGYRTRSAALPSPEGVFIHSMFDSSKLDLILDDIKIKVALVRMGKATLSSGPWCSFCQHVKIDVCSEKFQAATSEHLPILTLREKSIK